MFSINVIPYTNWFALAEIYIPAPNSPVNKDDRTNRIFVIEETYYEAICIELETTFS